MVNYVGQHFTIFSDSSISARCLANFVSWPILVLFIVSLCFCDLEFRFDTIIVGDYKTSDYCKIFIGVSIPLGAVHLFFFLTFVAVRIRILPKSFRDQHSWDHHFPIFPQKKSKNEKIKKNFCQNFQCLMFDVPWLNKSSKPWGQRNFQKVVFACFFFLYDVSIFQRSGKDFFLFLCFLPHT